MTHEWVAALYLPVSPQEAGRLANQDEANLRDRKVEVLDLLCVRCRTRFGGHTRKCIPADRTYDRWLRDERREARVREYHRLKNEARREQRV